MSLDGAVVSQLANEILTGAIDARVDKIAQPASDVIIVHLRSRNGNKKLLINLSAGAARVHFTQFVPENPQKPPMFCMLLRKHLLSARLASIKQVGLDRILHINFEGHNELGDKAEITLAVEVMGKYSNLILVNDRGIIIDALKKIDFNLSSVRQILPGLMYTVPPVQDKLDIVAESIADILERIKSFSGIPISKGIVGALQGFSPLPAREIAYLATGFHDITAENMDKEQWEKLEAELEKVKKMLTDHSGTPTMLSETGGRPKDFSFMNISQYEGELESTKFEDYSSLLDIFYTKRDTVERMRQKSGSLLKQLENTSGRISRRLAKQMEELEECKNREELKVMGDLLTANIYRIKRGDAKAELENFYSDNSMISISLDTRKTPAQNAQHYYSLYRKADTAEKKLTVLINKGEQELEYVDSILDSLKRSETEADLENIKAELIKAGYIKRIASKKIGKPQKQSFYTFLSTDGFKITAGRNNNQNDQLTLKDSNNDDIWFHTQKIPGSHVVITSEGKEVPPTTIEQAAIIAAYHSKARDSGGVPVDYAKVRYVKKPSGAKPGMVTYDNFKTIIVDPSEKIVTELEKNKEE